MHEQPLAGLERCPLEHIVPDGEHGLGQGGRLDESEALRHRQGGDFGRHGVFGIAAAIDERAYEIAVLEAGCAGTAGNDLARHLEPEKVGGALGRRVEALTLEHVGTVDAGRRDLDQDLAWAWRGHRPRRRDEHLRSATLLRFDDRHGLWQHRIVHPSSGRPGQ